MKASWILSLILTATPLMAYDFEVGPSASLGQWKPEPIARGLALSSNPFVLSLALPYPSVSPLVTGPPQSNDRINARSYPVGWRFVSTDRRIEINGYHRQMVFEQTFDQFLFARPVIVQNVARDERTFTTVNLVFSPDGGPLGAGIGYRRSSLSMTTEHMPLFGETHESRQAAGPSATIQFSGFEEHARFRLAFSAYRISGAYNTGGLLSRSDQNAVNAFVSLPGAEEVRKGYEVISGFSLGDSIRFYMDLSLGVDYVAIRHRHLFHVYKTPSGDGLGSQAQINSLFDNLVLAPAYHRMIAEQHGELSMGIRVGFSTGVEGMKKKSESGPFVKNWLTED